MSIPPVFSASESVEAFWKPPMSLGKEGISFQEMVQGHKNQTSPFLSSVQSFGDALRDHQTVLQKALHSDDNPLDTLQSVSRTRLLVDFVRALTKVSVESLKQLFQTPL